MLSPAIVCYAPGMSNEEALKRPASNSSVVGGTSWATASSSPDRTASQGAAPLRGVAGATRPAKPGVC